MTDDDLHRLVDAVTRLPAKDTEQLAAATRSGARELRALRSRSGGLLRDACSIILPMLEHATATEICGVLRGAVAAGRQHPARMDLVWTGPDVPGSISRLTSEIVADLVDQARSEVLLISYAMHNEPTLTAAITRAVAREVFVQVLCERTADNPGFRGSSVPFPQLRIRRLCWPAEQRPPGASMHAKALVIDRATALIGSANVTGTAMLRNIECGILTDDARIAAEIAESVDSLYARKILREFTS
ncbi:DISARM system phospholipase D-like protein DrmC [Rhodococcus sp. IITD102]|uniref:DISARM system phospholipase D-like protein DrmC n=1 Tax=Rhodococcus sp. IITD102 TaxID=3119531 RepID=UPI002FC2BA94